jgi:hypothetical protein
MNEREIGSKGKNKVPHKLSRSPSWCCGSALIALGVYVCLCNNNFDDEREEKCIKCNCCFTNCNIIEREEKKKKLGLDPQHQSDCFAAGWTGPDRDSQTYETSFYYILRNS